MGFVMTIVYLAVAVATLAGMWKVYEKCGRQGWEGIVPIYNLYVLTLIVGKPILWFILCFIPCVNLVMVILLSIELAKKFGKGAGYGVGLALLGFVFYPMLGFGPDKPVGAAPPATPV